MNKSGGKKAVFRSSLTEHTRQASQFSFLVFCRHHVAKYTQCSRSRGVETGEKGRKREFKRSSWKQWRTRHNFTT